jgi:hypothetical protein
MNRMTEWRSLAASALLATAAPGCFAVANLDRFEVEPALCESTSAMTRDYRWRLTTFDPHQGRRFEMRVVDAMTGRVAAGIVYDPIPDGRPTTLEGMLDDTLAPGDYETRFWADVPSSTGMGTVDAFDFGTDHAWIEEVPEGGCFEFEHMGPFDADVRPLDDPGLGNVIVTLGTLGDVARSALIYRVRNQNGDEVGFYRLDSIPLLPANRRPMTITDIAPSDTLLSLHAFIDLDRDGVEDPEEPSFDPEPNGADPDAEFVISDAGP